MPVMDLAEQKLKRPFPVSKLKWRDGPHGKELVYIDARDVMNRLDEVCGPSMWKSFISRTPDGVNHCTISIYSNTLKEWIEKSDGSDDTKIEPIKGGISEAFKRAAVHWGVARYLYHPGAFDENRTPAHWATPEGYDEIMDKRSVNSVVKKVK